MKKMVVTIISCLLILTCFCVNVLGEVEEKVAKIGNTEYSTLQAAFNATIGDGIETIVLLKDVTENISVNANKKYILDLNGKSVNFKSTTKPVIDINNSNASLYIKNKGTIKQQSDTYPVISCLGNLTIDKATIKNTHSSVDAGCISTSSTLTISGGNYAGQILFYSVLVTGGTFSENAYTSKSDDISENIPTGYFVMPNNPTSPTEYTVYKGDHKHGTQEYIDLEYYLTNYGYSLESGYYYLSSNLNIDKEIDIPAGKTVSICFNGKTLTSVATEEPMNRHSGIAVTGSLTVEDCNSAAGTLRLSSESEQNNAFAIKENGSLTIKNINVKSNSRGILAGENSTLLMESGYVQSQGFTVHLSSKSKFTLNGGTLENLNETSRTSELTCVDMFGDGDKCEFYFNDGTIILGENCTGIYNDYGLLRMTGGTIKSKTSDITVNCAIINMVDDACLYGGTISGLKTKSGAVLNLGDLYIGGNVKISGNSGPITKFAGFGYMKGQNLLLVNGRLIIPTNGDYAPNMDEMKVGIAYSDNYLEIKNTEGKFTNTYLPGLENCFTSDLDNFKIAVNNDGDACLELVAIPKENKKVEPKDESCEAVIGKDWTWDEKLGVCKLVGYRAVNTATN